MLSDLKVITNLNEVVFFLILVSMRQWFCVSDAFSKK